MMMRIRVEMMRGPLDGAVTMYEVPNGKCLAPLWIGPDPAQGRQKHAVAYTLVPGDPKLMERKMYFSESLTRLENLKRGLPA